MERWTRIMKGLAICKQQVPDDGLVVVPRDRRVKFGERRVKVCGAYRRVRGGGTRRSYHALRRARRIIAASNFDYMVSSPTYGLQNVRTAVANFGPPRQPPRQRRVTAAPT
ncbi:hypothetical protein B0H11DRAFT_1909908 [Mycena galericulata]|nr:hypothetical protein B0H11DRAFT_1909908 [Mycena galericulata]